MPEQQFTLPYQEITERPNRDDIRKAYKRTHRETFKVPLDHVRFRVGDEPFNGRIKPMYMSDAEWEEQKLVVLEIKELAEAMETEGQLSPIEGDPVWEDGVLIFYPTDGHRRTLSHHWLRDNTESTRFIEEGVWMVEVLINPKGYSELDRMKRVLTPENKLELRPMEIARQILRIKKYGDYSSEEMPYILGLNKSRQWIDNMLLLNELDIDDQIAIERGTLKVTNAITAYRERKKQEKEDKKAPAADQKPKDEKTFTPGGFESLSKDKDNQEDENEDEDDSTEDASGALRKGIKDLLGDKADDESSGDNTDPQDDDDEEEQTVGGQGSFKPVQYDNESVHNQEEKSNGPTDPKFREERPKNDQFDALPTVDFRKEKTEADMELTESIKMLDQISVRVGKLPSNHKQFIDDTQRTISILTRKLDGVKEIIKKAADRR